MSVIFLKRVHYKHSLITWGFFCFFFPPPARNQASALCSERVKVAVVNKYKTTEETVKWDKSERLCYLLVGVGVGAWVGGGVQCTFNISATSLTCYIFKLIQKHCQDLTDVM